MMQVIFFNNGNTGVFGDNGEQMPELQQPWFLKFLEFLEQHPLNLDIEKISFETPSSTGNKFKPFKIENGWNWEVD